MSSIFEPLTLRGVAIKNRIAMAPMLMYTGNDDGKVTDLHLAHYGARALGGVGLITTEVVAVAPSGRISEKDLGLWDNGQIEGLRRLSAMIRNCGAVGCLQLAHAGRKSQVSGDIYAPSALAHGDQSRVPQELTYGEIKGLVKAYGASAARAVETGFECLEIHAAHGYLIHEFLSPLSNRRMDDYGGERESRWRLLLEIVAEVRSVWPQDKPFIIRLSAEDKAGPGGSTVAETVELVARLKAAGVDMVSVSAGGLSPVFDGAIYPGYQVDYAEQVKREAAIPVGCNGSITSSELVEAILRRESADIVYIGRELLRNPFWLLDVARTMGVEAPLAIPTYARATGPYVRGH